MSGSVQWVGYMSPAVGMDIARRRCVRVGSARASRRSTLALRESMLFRRGSARDRGDECSNDPTHDAQLPP
jgi:hypothetical protein